MTKKFEKIAGGSYGIYRQKKSNYSWIGTVIALGFIFLIALSSCT